MNINYSEIIDLLQENCNHYRELITFENKKLQIITQNRVDDLSLCLKDEQALIMQSDALERKREIIFQRNNISGISLDELVNSCSDEFKVRLSSVARDFKKNILEVKNINSLCREIVMQKLSVVNEKLSKTSGDFYNPSGHKEQKSVLSSSLHRSI